MIDSNEIDKLIPREKDYMRIWDEFVEWFDGKEVRWVSIVEGESYNFESLPPEIQTILKEMMKDDPQGNHFGIYLNQ